MLHGFLFMAGMICAGQGVGKLNMLWKMVEAGEGDMKDKTIRERVEAYALRHFKTVPEQLPFNRQDYAVLRHQDTGRWYAVFIMKPRVELGLEGEGDATIVSLKIPDLQTADVLLQKPGYLPGFPSSKWNWVSIVLDGTVPLRDICHWLTESHTATTGKTKNQKVPLLKRE